VRTFSAPVAMTVCEKSCRVAIVLKNHSMEPRHQRRVLASGIAERLGTNGAGLKLVDLAQKRHDEGHRWPTIGPHSFESLNS